VVFVVVKQFAALYETAMAGWIRLNGDGFARLQIEQHPEALGTHKARRFWREFHPHHFATRVAPNLVRRNQGNFQRFAMDDARPAEPVIVGE
jgi:hypothetical protein